MSEPTFRVMTYNVHSCIGSDRKASPLRTAEVIRQHSPDIVALQELDAGQERSGAQFQAHVIAQSLNMTYRFHPSDIVGGGEYGNAILSRFPIRLVKAGDLPGYVYSGRVPEKRGALWVEVYLADRGVQVVTTHLGLTRRERLVQAHALLGPQWFNHPECRCPLVITGDFNALPCSQVYRLFRRVLRDIQCHGGNGNRPRRTWPSRCPVFRIDHVFVTPDIVVHGVRVPRTRLERTASDHLPLVADLGFL